MKTERLVRARHLMGWILTVSVLLSGLFLVLACLHIGLSGETPYTRERVAAALVWLAIPLGLTVVALLVQTVLCLLCAPLQTRVVRGDKPTKEKSLSPPKERILRVAVLSFALCLIVLGVLNGSMQDVLQKAIRICTECIGLG